MCAAHTGLVQRNLLDTRTRYTIAPTSPRMERVSVVVITGGIGSRSRFKKARIRGMRTSNEVNRDGS